MMTFLIVFGILSLLSSIFVVAAGMLSSRVSHQEELVEVYAQEDRFAPGRQSQSAQ